MQKHDRMLTLPQKLWIFLAGKNRIGSYKNPFPANTDHTSTLLLLSSLTYSHSVPVLRNDVCHGRKHSEVLLFHPIPLQGESVVNAKVNI